MNQVNETDLVRASQRGDLDSFNSLVEQYQGLVYNLSLRMLGKPHFAEDATQETFLSAYRAMGRFRGGNFRTWLLRIAANACRDQLRHRRSSSAYSLDALVEDSNLQLSDRAESPEDYALRRELASVINQGLAHLSPEQRLVVILCDVQGFDYEEMAQVTGISLGTVKSRLSRGRARLRNFLLEQRELLPRKFRTHDTRQWSPPDIEHNSSVHLFQPDGSPKAQCEAVES